MRTMKKPLCLMVAAAFAGAMLPAQAATASEKKEIAELRAQLKALQAEVEALKSASVKPAAAPAPVAAPAAAPVPAPAPAADSDEPSMDQRVTKMELQVEQLSTAANEGPIAGLSLGGYVDLGYFYNHNGRTNSFSFGRPNNSAYSYDNSSVGDIYLDIKKTFGTGAMAPSAEIVFAPNRGYGAGGSGGSNIIHTAQVTVPVSASTSYFFGQLGSWAGYEYYQSNQTNTISHNLLYDFGDPGFFTGAGVSYTQGNAAWKFMVGNPANKTFENTVHTPAFEYRLDYTWDSKTNIGWAGYMGQSTVNNRQDQPDGFRSTIFYTEADLAYTLFETTINAQIEYGHQKHAAWNGGDANWWGVSLLGNYRFNDDWGGTLRGDYLDNSKNGGGTSNVYGLANGTDPVNGFGIDPNCFADAQAADPTDFGYSCKGAKRTSLTAALLYYPTKQVTLKGELRFDHADMPVFGRKDGSFSSNNSLLSLQAVYSF